MTSHEFKCKQCDRRWLVTSDVKDFLKRQRDKGNEVTHGLFSSATNCEGAIVRVFSFAVKTSMPDHYNQSAGLYVTGEKELKDTYKRLSDVATERTGIPHNFVPVDHRDKQRLGVTNAGLDATYNRRKKLGMEIPNVIRPENTD